MRSVCFAFFLMGYSLALSQGVSRGVSSLKIPFTPFTAATGEAFIADTGNSQSVILNPSNIASNKYYGILISHNEWVQDIRAEFLSVVLPVRLGSLALSVGNTSIDNIEIREIPGPPLGTFNSQSAFLQLTYALPITDRIFAGVSPKFVYEKLYIEEASGLGADVGILYMPPVRNLSLGCSVTNLGNISAFNKESTDLPTCYRLGAGYNFSSVKFLFRTAAGLTYESGISVSHINIGVEAVYENSISARFGYRTKYEIGGLSFGIGIHYDIFIVEYSYLPPSKYELGSANIISVGTSF